MATETDEPTTTRGRVLVTFSRSWQALAAIRSLGKRGLEVIAGDEVPLTPGALSKYTVESFEYPSPEADPEGFLDALDEAVERFRPTADIPYVLLPVHRETYLIARHRERFEPRIAMALPPSKLIEAVRDKGQLVDMAGELAVPTPRTWKPAAAGEIADLAEHIEFPAFVKVRRGAGGVGIEKVVDIEQLEGAFERLAARLGPDEKPPIVQQAAPGSDYCVSALLDRGRTRAILTYRNLRSVADGAPGATRKTVQAPEPEAAATRLLEGLEWHGIAEVDFMWTGEHDDEACLIEVNPRLFGGLFQAIASGIDYPWMLFCLASGREFESPDEPRYETVSETPVVGLLATLREAVEAGDRWKALEAAWMTARKRFSDGAWSEGLQSIWRGLRDGLEARQREDLITGLLEEREATVSQLFADDDPGAALGLLYPLAIFLRQGKVTAGMLSGTEPVNQSGADPE